MKVEDALCMMIVVFVLAIPLFVWYSIWKEAKESVKIAKEIKPGDLYKCQITLNHDNPFAEPYISYVKIKEIRINSDGGPWVAYIENERIYTKELRRFLYDFKPVENENTSAIHQE